MWTRAPTIGATDATVLEFRVRRPRVNNATTGLLGDAELTIRFEAPSGQVYAIVGFVGWHEWNSTVRDTPSLAPYSHSLRVALNQVPLPPSLMTQNELSPGSRSEIFVGVAIRLRSHRPFPANPVRGGRLTTSAGSDAGVSRWGAVFAGFSRSSVRHQRSHDGGVLNPRRVRARHSGSETLSGEPFRERAAESG